MPKDCVRISEPTELQLVPLLSLDSTAPALYSAEFEVLKYKFSGLIAFRKMPEIKETRIVFLTETGIRVMEFSFQNGKAINTYYLDAIQRKSVIKFIGSFLEMLLCNPDYQTVCLLNTENKSEYYCKLKKGYATYEFDNEKRTYVLLHKSKKKQSEGRYILSPSLPEEVIVTMKYNTKIELQRVSNAFK